MCLGSSASFSCRRAPLGGTGLILPILSPISSANSCLKAFGAETAVVGEALGTVPEGLRDELAAAQILSYRVHAFRAGRGGVFAARSLSPLGRGLRRDA